MTDHAELARLADDLRKFEHHAVGSLKIDMDEVRKVIAACDRHAYLLAEIAALRAKATIYDTISDKLERRTIALDQAERQRDEALEALGNVRFIRKDNPGASESYLLEETTRIARTFLASMEPKT